MNSDATPGLSKGSTGTPLEGAGSPTTLSRGQRTKFFFRAVEVRLRFIGLFVGIGLLMTYWTTLEQYWDRWTRPASVAAADADSEYYCPMHPNVIRPGLEPNGAVPGCPICGMPLSKRKKGELPELPDGVLARVQLSPERVQMAGVKTVAASYMPLTKEIRTVGYVQYDEARQAEIVTRVGGYLEKLHVDKTFDQVDEGQPLAEIYSPDLYSGMQEVLLAKRHGSADLAASARQRLKLLGVDETEIDDALESTSAAARLLIRSPLAGQVIEKNVVQGASVEPGTVLFTVADLSTVWIEADAFERDLPFLYAGQAIEATVESLPGVKFTGEIALVYPELRAETRTNRVRVTVENPELLLRPGMFAAVRVETPMSQTEPFRTAIAHARQKPPAADDAALIAFQKICPVTGLKLGSMGDPLKVSVQEESVFICCAGCEAPLLENPADYLAKLAPPPEDAVLTIPESAVIDTGASQVAYVEREPGVFEGVAVTLGPRTGGFYPVLSGLAPGEKVAAAGSFLLDAETRLNPSAASAYFGATGSAGSEAAGSAQTAGAAEASKRRAGELTASQLKQIDKLPEEDRGIALAQRLCPVTDEPLGSMGVPVKMVVEGRTVLLCCKGCESQVVADPQAILRKTDELTRSHRAEPPAAGAAGHQH